MQLAQALALLGIDGIGVLERRGDAHPDAALDELLDRLDDLSEVLRPAHLVVLGRVGPVERDLDLHRQVGEGLELPQAPLVEERRVGEHHRGQPTPELCLEGRHVVADERLVAGQPEARGAKVPGLRCSCEDRVAGELAAPDQRPGLRQAVRALQVAVVVQVEPQTTVDSARGDGLGQRTHVVVRPRRRSR
ncbi:MAG: hypothetical protein M3P50_03755 [Actinomycetota bacterium]|nr:hypothetical protein [Actinomycetota bacterium]